MENPSSGHKRRSHYKGADSGRTPLDSKSATPADTSDAKSLGAGAGDEGKADLGDEEKAILRVKTLLANLFVPEHCAFCGNKIPQPGYVILEYDELGTF